MTCTACGEHPKENTAKGFPKAVVEINNPETLVLLRKVVIPASMGDETAFPPAIGKYFNVLLHYEASGSNYLYSSDGIPTEIGANIPQEVLDRIEALEDGYDDLAEDYEQLQSQVGDVSEALSAETSARENADIGLQGQIDALTVSSGVIDVLGTYQDLQNYDTTHVKEDDIIKVLQDSTHSNAMSYYKWVITSNVGAWVYVGGEGPFYTKSEADTLLNAKQNTLTAGSNVQIVNDTISATDTTYTAGTGLALNGTQFSVDTTAIATQSDLTAGLATKQDTLTAGTNIQINNNTISATDTTYSDFTGTDGTAAGTAGLVPAPATTDAGKFLKADGTWDTAGGGSGPTVVQTTGTSTTDVMSQNATTSMVFADPSDCTRVQIGKTASTQNINGIAIGEQAKSIGTRAIVIGDKTNTADVAGTGASAISIGVNTTCTSSSSGIAIGTRAQSTGESAIAMGCYNEASGRASVAIGGYQTKATGAQAVAVGSSTTAGTLRTEALADGSTVIGARAQATSEATGAIAIGFGAKATRTGQMDISASSYGYKGSNYRILTGLYNPEDAHDAATKGYVDNSLLGKANKISVVQTSASTIEINPNTFYKFGEVASLTITLASITDNTIYNEYMFEFVSGSTATTLTLPSSIKWLETPTIDANKIYQCSIVDNIGILVGVTNV